MKKYKFLVGFKGDLWSGGSFESHVSTPQKAAAEQFAKAPEMPFGDKISLL